MSSLHPFVPFHPFATGFWECFNTTLSAAAPRKPKLSAANQFCMIISRIAHIEFYKFELSLWEIKRSIRKIYLEGRTHTIFEKLKFFLLHLFIKNIKNLSFTRILLYFSRTLKTMFSRSKYLRYITRKKKHFAEDFFEKNYSVLYQFMWIPPIFLEENLARNTVVSWAVTQLIPRSCIQLHLEMNASIVIISISWEYAIPITGC